MQLKPLRSCRKLLNAIHDPYLLRVVKIHFKFEHFFEIISISVISKKIYLISLKLQPKPGVIKTKITQWNIWHIFSPRWTKHFIFEHFSEIISISVLSKKIFLISLKLQPKPVMIKMKITQCDRWPIFSPRWAKHFEFGHFIANITITVFSLKIY